MGKDWSKAAPLTGVLFAVLAASGAVTEGSTPSATASGSTVTAFYVAHQHRQQLAAVLLAFAFIVLVCFAATLRAQLRRPNGRCGSQASLALRWPHSWRSLDLRRVRRTRPIMPRSAR